MKHMIIIIGMVLSISLLSGCATIGSLQPREGAFFQVNDRTYEQVWESAIKVASRSWNIVETNKQGGIIKAERTTGITSGGEVVGIYISPPTQDSKTFTVEVVIKKQGQIQVTGHNWEKTIVEGMKAELK